MAVHAQRPDYYGIKVVFTDLDGTLFPGAFEDSPKEKRPGLLRNMASVKILEEKHGIPVIPATGNNLAVAQAKFMHPETGEMLRDLRSKPGVFCNGALVIGAGGREVMARSLASCKKKDGTNFIEAFMDTWTHDLAASNQIGAGGEPIRDRLLADCCPMGIGKEMTYFLRDENYQRISDSLAETVGSDFITHMEMSESDYQWCSAQEFCAQASDILSFVLLFPKCRDYEKEVLLNAQAWLHESALLEFGEPCRLSSGGPSSNFEVICKHVHVPGIGPEIDISPVGVNKGSAIVAYLESEFKDAFVPNEAIAVFGDAGNDVELFGMKRFADGSRLEPLFDDKTGIGGRYAGYRPSVRVAMPWANDELLTKDATEVAKVHVVLEKMAEAKSH